MKGFKVFNSDWTGQGGYKFEVGKSFEIDQEPKVGIYGFHFCKHLIDCYDYLPLTEPKKYAVIEAYGQIDNHGTTEYATNKIRIVRELNWDEVKKQLLKETSCR